jgi:DeoR family transcriptional regulator of aga operon
VRAQIDLVVSGGTARHESYELVGPIAEATLSGLNLDVAILGIDGISASAGLTTHDEVEAQTNRAILGAAERVIVVGDGTKVGRRAFARIAEITAVSDLVTDKTADEKAVTALERAGVRVHQV